MAVTATRSQIITYTVDVTGTETISAASNAASPGSVTLHTFTGAGFNTVTLPTGGSTVVSGTIVPPAGNTQTITLKGVTGDTGVALHLTDPTTIAFASTVTTFGLTVGGTITGLRIFWT